MHSLQLTSGFNSFLRLIFLLLCVPVDASSQAHDPNRGMLCGNFASFTPKSLNDGYPKLNLDFSVLGNVAREDSLLEYAREHHITSLSLYDLYPVFRYNDTPNSDVNGIKLVELLCNFMNKARNQYCITEIGVAGGIDSFFFDVTSDTSIARQRIQYSPGLTLDSSLGASIAQSDSALHFLLTTTFYQGDSLLPRAMLMKFFYDVLFRQSGVCNYYFDYLCYENEWWNTGGSFPASLQDLQHMRTLQANYNTTHTHPLRTSVYVRSSFGGGVDTAQQAIIRQLDGTADGTLPRLADRIMAVHYGATPAACYNSYGGQIRAYADSLTIGGTDYHPYISTETFPMSGYIDYLGVWLRNKYFNNIFVEERDFYDRWRVENGSNFGSASDNSLEPGGFVYFQSYFMVDSLKHPRLFRTNAPLCTNGASGDSLRFTYQGPLEQDITYELSIFDNAQTLVASDTGRTGNYPLTQANLPLPSHYLSRNGSPYRVVLELNYGGCSYAYADSVVVLNGPSIAATSPTTFCEGGSVVLQASGGTSFSWLRNGFPIAGSNASTIIANQAGTYQCQITGSGTCSGSSNSIAVNVLPNPAIEFTTSCYNSDSAEIRVTSPGARFSWITGDTTSSIIAKAAGGYRYYVTVTQSNQCQQTSYKSFSVPIVGFTANPHISTLDGTRTICAQDSFLLTPTQYCLGCLYEWNYNGSSTTTYGNYYVHPVSDSSFQISVHMISASGCDGYDTATIRLFQCCPAQDTTILGSDSTSHFTNWSGRTISIAGDLVVNTNFTITNSSLLMGDNSRIFISPGRTLTIQNSRLSACNALWGGISFADSTGLLILSGDTLEDAQMAIADSAGSRISVTNTRFNRNRRSVILYGSGAALTSVVSGCTFTCEDNSGLATQTNDGGYAYSGVETNGLNGWTLGGNQFRHLYYGLRSENSSITVQACTFRRMRRYAYAYGTARAASYTWENDGFGVYSLNQSGSPVSLTVQGSSFTDCGYGVQARNGIQTTISGSSFDSLRYAAISLVNPIAVDVNIHDNSIAHYLNGITVTEPRLASSMTIRDNTFTSPSNLNTSPLYNAAVNWSVKLQNRLPGVTTASVSNNRMMDQLKGIYLNGCEETDINANFIQLRGAGSTTRQYGIWLVNSSNCTVTDDSVVTTSPVTDPTLARGIRFESSTGCSIRNNYLLNLGSGINGLNFCDLTSLCGNDLWNCARGLDVFNITIPQQGDVNAPQDNMWRNMPLANRTVGSTAVSSRILFYHRYTQNDPNNKFSPGTNLIIQSFSNTTGLSPCNVLDTFPQPFTEITEQVIQDSIVFLMFGTENKWFADKYAFHLLSKDSMLMNQGLPSDQQRQRFFDDIQVRNVGKIEAIQVALEAENYLQAITRILAFQPENLIEQNLKDVLELMEAVQSSTPLTTADSLTLNNISAQLAFEGGAGVFMARAILDVEYDDELTGALLRQANGSSATEQPNLLLYPNPTNGKLTFSANLTQYQGCRLEIHDVHGRTLITEFLNTVQTIADKDYSALGSGIYWIQVFCEDQLIETRKLVVQK
ncbi:MAG: T9SS type A sorting domain-containing protein [Bacteroidota bacterium]